MPSKKKILITDRFAQEAFVTLENQSFLQINKSKNFEPTKDEIKDVHGLIIRSRTKITEDLLKQAKNLQVIVTATSGFDHIDLEACNQWGITAMYTPDANIESAAQLTWALVLSCANKLPQSATSMKKGEWIREPLIGLELHRKTYGIVGLGRIGTRVAEIANAFGMNVVAYDPYCDEQNFRDADAERLAFEEVLKRSDVVSFHVPATKETYRMLNSSNMEFMNRGLIIVNTSRGSAFHENDIYEALEKGWIGALGLDVYEREPLPKTSKFFQYANVVMTPHTGANTTDAFQKASEQAALKIIRFFMDSSTTDTLPPKAAWYGAQAFYKGRE